MVSGPFKLHDEAAVRRQLLALQWSFRSRLLFGILKQLHILSHVVSEGAVE